MAKFVTLPQHWNRSPITVNVDKVYLIDHSTSHPSGTRITLGIDWCIEVNLHVDEVVALLNTTKE